MKALVKRDAKEGLWLEDVPLPEVGNNDMLAQKMSEKLLERGIYAIGFFFPVVPKG